jgi:hypothetical protein
MLQSEMDYRNVNYRSSLSLRPDQSSQCSRNCDGFSIVYRIRSSLMAMAGSSFNVMALHWLGVVPI